MTFEVTLGGVTERYAKGFIWEGRGATKGMIIAVTDKASACAVFAKCHPDTVRRSDGCEFCVKEIEDVPVEPVEGEDGGTHKRRKH